MRFIDVNRDNKMLDRARQVNSWLIKAREAQKAGDHDKAEGCIQDALNAMGRIVQHLQFTDSVPRVDVPQHYPIGLWIDQETDARIEEMAEAQGVSKVHAFMGALADTFGAKSD